MKYKYEFEAEEGFQPGCCYECPLGYIDYNSEVVCSLNVRYDECPLEKVEE